MKCPECQHDDNEEMIKIHLILFHGYTEVRAKQSIKEKIWRGEKYG